MLCNEILTHTHMKHTYIVLLIIKSASDFGCCLQLGFLVLSSLQSLLFKDRCFFFLFRSLFYGTYYFSMPPPFKLKFGISQNIFSKFYDLPFWCYTMLLSLKKYDNLYDRYVHVDIWAGENTVPVCGDNIFPAEKWHL